MFRFTIRDVLWLMVVVGLGVAWWVSDRNRTAEIAHFKQYRGAALALERIIVGNGWSVSMSKDGGSVYVEQPPGGSSSATITDLPLPSKLRDRIEAQRSN